MIARTGQLQGISGIPGDRLFIQQGGRHDSKYDRLR